MMTKNTWLKALGQAVLVPVLVYIGTSLQAGSWDIDWSKAGIIAASALVAYLLRQLGPKLPDENATR